MPNVNVNTTLSIGGIGTTSTKTFTVDQVINNAPNETVPAYKVATLSTRTSDTAGVVTSSAHGIPDTATISLYWTISGVNYYRYDVDIDSVLTDTITFSGGSGDVLPAQSTVINVSQGLQIDFMLNGTNLKALAVGGTQRTISSFIDDAGASQHVVEMTANEKFQWYTGNGYTNPITGHNIEAINIYNISTTACTYSATAGIDNTLDQV